MEDVAAPESAGMIQISRISGQTVLFGSPFVHQGYVALRIHKAASYRNLSETTHRIGNRNPYIEVYLSYSQFAEAITTMNMGEGVPCTIHSLMGERLEQPWLENDRMEFDNEINSVVIDCIENINDLITAIDEERMSVKAKARLIGIARNSISRLNSSLPFIADMYLEYLDKLEQRAKTEIAAYADMTAYQYGLDAISNLPQLPEA